jgi:hypothetical protein
MPIPEQVRDDKIAALLKVALSRKITLCRGAGRRHVQFRVRE